LAYQPDIRDDDPQQQDASCLQQFHRVASEGRCDATYGSLGATIGVKTRVLISTNVVLSGTEPNAEIQNTTNVVGSL
jgi:hypothetical protein